jgi:hypothetical protein
MPTSPIPTPLLAYAALFAVVLAAPRAQADPLFDWGQDALEDRYLDGDFDEEDHIVSHPSHLGSRLGTGDARGTSWVSVAGFYKSLMSGKTDAGGILVVGLALDRLTAGPVHRTLEVPKPPPPPPPPSPTPAPPPERPVTLLAPALARQCVAAALRNSGLGTDDARIDALVARARASAWLPETRMRAMRLWTDANHTTTVASTDTANFYDAVGANLMLELRLTWRLDRLVFAGDEPTLERVRLERVDARSRLATRTLEALFAWERAKVEEARAPAGSNEKLEAAVHAAEAQATLDVLTGGWFSEEAVHDEGWMDAPEARP